MSLVAAAVAAGCRMISAVSNSVPNCRPAGVLSAGLEARARARLDLRAIAAAEAAGRVAGPWVAGAAASDAVRSVALPGSGFRLSRPHAVDHR